MKNTLKRNVFPIVRYILLIFIALAKLTNSNAQTIKTVEATYNYVAMKNESMAQAEKNAIEGAKLTAIASEFGTVISNMSVITMSNSTTDEITQSRESFSELSSTNVLGEWIETISISEPKVAYENNLLSITVTVKGKARERTMAKPEFMAKLLRNGCTPKYESDKYKDGDDITLLFKTPVDGYLLVYLIDEYDNVISLLPYYTNNSAAFEVKGGNEYLFFCDEDSHFNSQKNLIRPANLNEVVTLNITAERQLDINEMHVIFSPNKMIKANDKPIADDQPLRSLSRKEFLAWLSNARIDKELADKVIRFTVSKE